MFGDVHGQVNALLFSAATMALFDRPSQPAGSKQGIHCQVLLERFDWFMGRIQTRVAFGWLSERSGEKTSCPRTI